MSIDDYSRGSEAFVKQRRNLMTLSILLFVLDYAGATFPSEIKAVGFELHFSDPGRIEILMWVALAYFMIRYAQYLDINEMAVCEQEISLHPKLSQLALEKLADSPDKVTHENLNNRLKEGWSIRTSSFTRKGEVKHLTYWEITMDLTLERENGKQTTTVHHVTYRLSRIVSARMELMRWVRVIMRTPYVTQYIIPVVFPLFVAMYHLASQ